MAPTLRAPVLSRHHAAVLGCSSSEPGEDYIGVDGVQKFCEELEVDPTDIVVLVVSHYMVRRGRRGRQGGAAVEGACGVAHEVCGGGRTV